MANTIVSPLRTLFTPDYISEEKFRKHNKSVDLLLQILDTTMMTSHLSGSKKDRLFLPPYTVHDEHGERTVQSDWDIIRIKPNHVVYPDKDSLPCSTPDHIVSLLDQEPCHDGFTQLLKIEVDPNTGQPVFHKIGKEPGEIVFKSKEGSVAEHHPNDSLGLVDEITARRLSQWPIGLTDILTRQHPSGWPGVQLIKNLAKATMLIIHKPHVRSADKDHEYRFSYSFLESLLLNDLPDCVRYAFVMAKLVCKEYPSLREVNEDLRTYQLKTVLLTLYEETSVEQWDWNDRSDEENVLFILKRLHKAYREKYLGNFFVKSYNILDRISNENLDDIACRLERACEVFEDVLKYLQNHVVVHDFSLRDDAQEQALEASRVIFTNSSTTQDRRVAITDLRSAAKQFPADSIIAVECFICLIFLKRYNEAETHLKLYRESRTPQHLEKEPTERICRKICRPDECGRVDPRLKAQLERVELITESSHVLLCAEVLQLHARRPNGEFKEQRRQAMIEQLNQNASKYQKYWENIVKQRRENKTVKRIQFHALRTSVLLTLHGLFLKVLSVHEKSLEFFVLAFRLYPSKQGLLYIFLEAGILHRS